MVFIPDDITTLETIPNARFFDMHPRTGEPVKVTLRPNERKLHCQLWWNGEGYTVRATTYHHAGAEVQITTLDQGRDCDGYHTREWTIACALDELTDGLRDEDGVRFPNWRKVASSQRDFTAEAAGY